MKVLKKILFTMIIVGTFSLGAFAQKNDDKKDSPPKRDPPKVRPQEKDKPKEQPKDNPDQGKKPKKPEGEEQN